MFLVVYLALALTFFVASVNDVFALLIGVKFGKQYMMKPEMNAKGVDFYSGSADDPKIMEQRVFINAVKGEGEVVVKPEQAFVVTQLLEAIYESAKTGKPVYFNE